MSCMGRTYVLDIKRRFKTLMDAGVFSNGNLEILGASFVADEDVIFGEPNKKYIQAEIDWYKSQSLNVNDLGELYGKVPIIWKESAANTRGEINSNYGYLAYSWNNDSQFDHVIRELKDNPYSRRAVMIYTNPAMHRDHRRHGKNDFVCTNAVSYHITDDGDYVECVVQMRSNDAVFGYINDLAWQKHVLRDVANELNLLAGRVYWQCQSLHIYPRHFKHVQNWRFE